MSTEVAKDSISVVGISRPPLGDFLLFDHRKVAPSLPMASRTVFKRLITTLWVLVFLEFVLTIATLGVTASAAQGFRQNLNYPRIPGKLAYNIAAAVITLLVLLIVIPLELLEYPSWIDLNTRWHSWPRISILGMLSGFWIGGVASSVYNCGDICSPRRSAGGFVAYAGICCSCDEYKRFGCSRASTGHPSYSEPIEHRYQATKALDAILM